MAIPLGLLNFEFLAYNDLQIATALQSFISSGSRRSGISKNDLKIVSDQATIPERFDNIGIGLSNGTKLFDLLMYFSLPVGERPRPVAAAPSDLPTHRDAKRIGEAVFYLAFFLLTRAHPPSGTDTTRGSSVPAFLQTILGMNESPKYYTDLLASFDLGKLHHTWIRHINWNAIGQESLNRFGLGVAGYRQLQPFNLLPCRPDASENAKEAYRFVRELTSARSDWAIHPVTRDPAILNSLGNLNKGAANLMLQCFTTEQLNDLKRNKIIFEVPTPDPRYSNWQGWTMARLPNLRNPIFVPIEPAATSSVST